MKKEISVLAVFKNEESFLPEWIDHYFARNIDHLYLIDDNSSDLSKEIVLSHENKINITLVNADFEDQKIKEHWRQEILYNKYYKYILSETEWLGVFDLDEFCYSPIELDFKKILRQFKQSEIQEVIVDWYWFGSNGHATQPQKIVESFTKRSNKLSKFIVDEKIESMGIHRDWCCKSFSKTKFISSIRHHYNKFNYYNSQSYISHGKNKSFCINLSEDQTMLINHYIGSEEYYFKNKVTRGSCNNNISISANKSKLYQYLNLNEVLDERLKKQNLTIDKNSKKINNI